MGAHIMVTKDISGSSSSIVQLMAFEMSGILGTKLRGLSLRFMLKT